MIMRNIRYTLQIDNQKIEIDFKVKCNYSLGYIRYKIADILGLQTEEILCAQIKEGDTK